MKTEPPDGLPVVLAAGAASNRANNNDHSGGKGERAGEAGVPSCFLHIPVKEEPPDEDEDEAPPQTVPTVPGPGPSTLVVSADEGIVIKTEVVEATSEQMEDEDEYEEEYIGLDVEGEEDDLDDIEDSECDFDEDDKDDADYELDSSEAAADSPDSGGKEFSGDEKEVADTKKKKAVAARDRGAGEDEEEEDNGERGSFDFNGMTIETVGNYSRCPRCDKNIKSTFIIRHIKLHDAPAEKYDCPEKDCGLQVRTDPTIYYSYERSVSRIHEANQCTNMHFTTLMQ